jgi:RNA polymerase sigma factor (sigma-70 family)
MSAINNDRFRMLLRSRPKEALELLYKIHYKSLLRLALTLTRDRDAARDVVQETFLHIWANRKELTTHHEKSIEHYLVRVVRNMSVTYFNRKQHIDIDDLTFLKKYKGATNPVEDSIVKRELISEMRFYILTLSMREQQCLLMKMDRGMSLDQIADELAISRKMVEKSQTKALKRLKKW